MHFKLIYPKVGCEKCDELIADDEEHDPQCEKCPIVFPIPDNEFVIAVYSALSFEFITDAGLQAFAFGMFQKEFDEMSNDEKFSTFRKLELMHKEIKLFFAPPKPSDKKPKKRPKKRR